MRKFVHCVDLGTFGPLSQIQSIAFDESLTDAEKVHRIQNVLEASSQDREIEDEQLTEFKHCTSSNENGTYFTIFESKSVKLQNRISEIVKELEFNDDDTPLTAAIRHYQSKDGAVTETAPTGFLDESDQRLLRDKTGKFRVSLYKALLFFKIADAIKTGLLNVMHSYKYRSLEDYLIPKTSWDGNRDGFLCRSEMQQFKKVNSRSPSWLICSTVSTIKPTAASWTAKTGTLLFARTGRLFCPHRRKTRKTPNRCSVSSLKAVTSRSWKSCRL